MTINVSGGVGANGFDGREGLDGTIGEKNPASEVESIPNMDAGHALVASIK